MGDKVGTLSLTSVPASVSAARRFALDSCPDLEQDLRDVVELLVSELATNALVHGDGEVLVTAQRQGGRLRVEVSDSSPELPRVRAAGPDAEGGRGLGLVATLASRWGATPAAGGGKTVWFEVDPAAA